MKSLNSITKSIVSAIIFVLIVIWIANRLSTARVNTATEFLDIYKNCIIVGKENKDNTYKLKLCNPYIHENELKVDYVILVKDYIYFNKFIGDTIK